MARFQQLFLMITTNLEPEIFDRLRSYSNLNSNEEVCGFIVEKDGLVDFIPVDNKHPDKKHFVLISPKDYLRIKNEYTIMYYFHSHVSNCDFSETDIVYQKYHNIDMLLYDNNRDLFKEMKCKL